MVSHINQMIKQCPKQKYVLGGHSQGGNLTFHAIPRMTPDTLSRIIAVTMFGSPACPSQVADRCNSYCYKGDFACDGANGGAFGSGGTKGVQAGLKGMGGSGAKGLGGSPETMMRTVLQDGCPATNIETRGYTPKGSGMPHMLYNSDGYCKSCDQNST
jgi:hypothetical protein